MLYGISAKCGGQGVADRWVAAAGVNGLVAIAMGAFTAHGLRGVIGAEALGWIDTASRYQMSHALALLAVALLLARAQTRRDHRLLQAIAWTFLAGIILFAGSLYLLAFTHVGAFAWITPLGGIALMAAWVGLIIFGVRRWYASSDR